jgi:tetratricopeptide (TPR) repeat protein
MRVVIFFFSCLCLLLLVHCKFPSSETKNSDNALQKKEPQAASIQSQYDQALSWAEQGDRRIVPFCDSLLKSHEAQTVAAAHYYLGIYAAEKKDTISALQNFDKSIVADYTFLEAYIEKAALLLSLGKAPQAQAELQLLREVAPTYPACHYWIAKVAEAQKQVGIAIEHYKLALSLDSSLVEAQQGLQRLQK